jgi:hypothetical protein
MKRITLIFVFESGAGNRLTHEKGLFVLKIKNSFYKKNIQSPAKASRLPKCWVSPK